MKKQTVSPVWTYIRLRKPTAIKLRVLKAELGSEMYDDVVELLLNKFKQTKNEKNKGSNL